ncbi:MAG: flavodoxin-dependent (E)-4-hydroxy-3-methylbut-2-enyl-diphosphate synthase [bacterium]
MRRKSCPVRVGSVTVGGGTPVSVQSMTKTDTRDVPATVRQIDELAAAGCEIIRVAVVDMEAAEKLKDIRAQIAIPLVADIHFDYRLALQAIKSGVDGLRINPGNIGAPEAVREVVQAAKARRVPIRIGVNSGSLEKDIWAKYGRVTAAAMTENALRHVDILEDLDFYDIIISLKATDVLTTIAAYRQIAAAVDYPLHLGITEAGTMFAGTVKSAVGIGTLLADGIGDTIRVSLTGAPAEEVRVGWEILRALNLRQRGVEVISCPTCGRCQIDMIPLAEEVNRRVQQINRPLKVAVMGCAVNGPGEAKEADFGIAGGRGEGLLFRRGQIIRKVQEEKLVEALMEEIENAIDDQGK